MMIMMKKLQNVLLGYFLPAWIN